MSRIVPWIEQVHLLFIIFFPPRATLQKIELQFAISIIQECQHEIIQKPMLLVLTGIELKKSQLLVLAGVLHQ
jgi:hypothetical protein